LSSLENDCCCIVCEAFFYDTEMDSVKLIPDIYNSFREKNVDIVFL